MRSLRHFGVLLRTAMLLTLFAALIGVSGCGRGGRLTTREYAYVAAPQITLRDRLSAVYNKVGTVPNGQRVEVLEKSKRFYRVRAEGVGEGWVEERYLVDQGIYDGFAQLSKQYGNLPGQAHGAARVELNMHLTPARDGEHLYQMKEGEKVEVLQRAVTDKNAKAVEAYQQQLKKIQQQQSAAAAQPQIEKTSVRQPSRAAAPAADAKVPVKSGSAKTGSGSNKLPEPPPSIPEDWWLVRDSQKRVGWVLARMIDVDVPIEIAQYAEGQRIVANFVINNVQDRAEDGTTKPVNQYLMLTTEPKDGQPFDYNHIRVFSWNGKRHRYETAYRERNLFGTFPVTVGRESFDKEGELPTFTIHVQDDKGQTVEKKYKMNGPIVRRVLSPQEDAAQKAAVAQKLEDRRAAREARIAQYRATHPAHSKTRSPKHR